MKKIINWLLLLGTVISIGVALKYSALPVPAFIPDEFSDFWITSAEEQQEYVLLYDIAVGFIMSALFYFIVEEIPDKVRIHKAKQLIRESINQLVGHMEQLINIVIAKYNRNQNLKELAQKDFLLLDGEVKFTVEEISYLTTTYYVKNRKKKTAIHQYGNINKVVKYNVKKILDDISVIKNYEYFYASDSRLVECIRKIEACSLISYYLEDRDKQKNIPCFQLHGTSKAMSEFVELYLQLIKCKFHTEYTITTLDSKDQTEKYRNDRESGALLQGVIEIQESEKNVALDNPTAVISSSKYTTDILISQLKRNFIAAYYYIDNLPADSLAGFKFIVLVVDSESKNAVIRLMKEQDIQSGILFLTDHSFLKRGIRNELGSISRNIVGELYFKSSFKLGHFPVLFNKEEPSEKCIANLSAQIKTTLYGKRT